jgi:hypothetical protein
MCDRGSVLRFHPRIPTFRERKNESPILPTPLETNFKACPNKIWKIRPIQEMRLDSRPLEQNTTRLQLKYQSSLIPRWQRTRAVFSQNCK